MCFCILLFPPVSEKFVIISNQYLVIHSRYIQIEIHKQPGSTSCYRTHYKFDNILCSINIGDGSHCFKTNSKCFYQYILPSGISMDDLMYCLSIESSTCKGGNRCSLLWRRRYLSYKGIISEKRMTSPDLRYNSYH